MMRSSSGEDLIRRLISERDTSIETGILDAAHQKVSNDLLTPLMRNWLRGN
jgi:hypothetical protein